MIVRSASLTANEILGRILDEFCADPLHDRHYRVRREGVERQFLIGDLRANGECHGIDGVIHEEINGKQVPFMNFHIDGAGEMTCVPLEWTLCMTGKLPAGTIIPPPMAGGSGDDPQKEMSR